MRSTLDTALPFPHVHVIPASAGSGKTYTLSHRYVQFLLSEAIPSAGLRNILAITFTKVAAKEMKERILQLLMRTALGDAGTIAEMRTLVALSGDQLQKRAAVRVEEILRNYSDFNVRTIDSFLTTIYKASAMELGVPPTVEIDFDHAAVIDRAFRQFSQQMREGSADAQFVDDLLRLMEQNDSTSGGFLWNPFSKIVREVQGLQGQLGKFVGDPSTFDGTQELADLKKKIVASAGTLQGLLEASPLPVNTHYKNDVAKLAAGDILTVASKERKKKYFNKYTEGPEAEKEIRRLWKVITPLEEAVDRYLYLYSQTYYRPFVRAVGMIEESVRSVKRIEGLVVMDDITRTLGRYMSTDVVPEVYLKLGERLSHFMVDEFQDTSPVQWRNLTPLIEEALSKGGTLFAVGDTKQSIYSFRGGDWKIFRDLIAKKYFPSTPAEVLPLTVNHRSAQALVDFVREVFSVNVQRAELSTAASQSGLYNFAQEVREKEKGKGYVESVLIDRNADDASDQHRAYILNVIADCRKRGYGLSDIAILTPTNAEVVEISSWLNGAGIDVLSLSTLDIRKRKAVGEMLALLHFLDAPIDTLSFVTVLTGSVMRRLEPSLTEAAVRDFLLQTRFDGTETIYRAFRSRFRDVWERRFERLFTLVGYMPLYDIVSEAFKTFDVFSVLPEEESSLVKLLECVKQFENSGSNSLKDFLSFSQEESSDAWSVQVPGNVEAIRVMTVHKAKGLGFPVVLVSLMEKKSRATSLVMRETEQGVEVLRVAKGYGERSETLHSIVEQRELEQTVDELNKIYVALTRARKEMYVVTLYKDLEKLPANILPQIVVGKKYPSPETEPPEERPPLLPSLYNKTSIETRPASYQKIGVDETHRGDLIHAILSAITVMDGMPEQTVDAAITRATQVSPEEAASVRDLLVQFLSLPAIAEYFTAKLGRRVLNEQEVTSAEGRLYRMDRVIIDPDRVTVADFKTGSDEHQAEYEEQVKNYIRMLQQIHPGIPVSGVLLYIDLKKGAMVA